MPTVEVDLRPISEVDRRIAERLHYLETRNAELEEANSHLLARLIEANASLLNQNQDKKDGRR